MSLIQVTQTRDRQLTEAVALASPYAVSGSFAFVPGQKTFGTTFYSEVGTIDKTAKSAGIVNASGTTSSYISVGQVQQALVGSSWVFQFSPLDTSQRWLSGTVDTGFNYFEDIVVNSDSTISGVSAGRLAFGMRRDGGVNASRVGNTTNVCLTVGAVHTAVILLTSTSSFEIWVDGVNQPITYGTTNPIGDTAGLTEFPLALLNRNLRNAFSNGTNVDLFLYARLPLLVDAAVLSRNPWQLFEPQSIWVPVNTGGTSHIITPTGGVSFSGSGNDLKSKVISPSGGPNFAGTGSIAFSSGGGTSYIIMPTGGVSFGGSGDQVKEKVIIPTGGVSFSGTGTQIDTKIIQPIGGVSFGGTGSMTSNTTPPGSGNPGERTKVGTGT